MKIKQMRKLLIVGLLWVMSPGLARAQMNMNPYFSTIGYPLESNSLMLMVMPDFQSARYGNNFVTGMLMAEYGGEMDKKIVEKEGFNE